MTTVTENQPADRKQTRKRKAPKAPRKPRIVHPEIIKLRESQKVERQKVVASIASAARLDRLARRALKLTEDDKHKLINTLNSTTTATLL